MSETEFQNIAKLLRDASVAFEVIEHAPVRTSEEAARVRGQPLKQGVKALVIKFKRSGGEHFVIVNIPADRKLDWKKAKHVLKAQEIRFASEQEVLEQTGCEPGGVPPLAHKNKLAILADPEIFEEPTVEFNAGLTTKSIRLSGAGLRKAFEATGAAFFNLSA